MTVVTICMIGAMSPGPSYAVVVRHTLTGGRRSGLVAALAHGAGVGFYALACISGLAFIITASPLLSRVFQTAGAIYLLWIGVRSLMAKPAAETQVPAATAVSSAARDGFLIVFLNPKIAVFFIALFSQVIGTETSWLARFVYAGTAWFLDTLWYLIVAWLFSTPLWFERLQKNAIWLDRIFGIILLALGIKLLLATLK